MRYTLDFLGCAALVIWMVEYLGYHASGNIHLLLISGLLLFAARVVLGLAKKPTAIE